MTWLRCGDLIWVFIMLGAFAYFGWHLAKFFQPALTTILFAYGLHT